MDYDWGQLYAAIIKFNYCKTIVEIGVQYGITTEHLCRAAKLNGGTVYGYDIFGKHGQRQQFDEFADKEDVEKRLWSRGVSNFKLTEIDLFSDDFPQVLASDTANSIDFAFIDTDHSYKGVHNNFFACYPLLSKPGIIALHDTRQIDGGREFMTDLRTKYFDGTYDIIDFPFGYGDKRAGTSFLVRRGLYTLGTGIDKVCDLKDRRQEILSKESGWYQSEVNNNKSIRPG